MKYKLFKKRSVNESGILCSNDINYRSNYNDKEKY